MDDADATGHSAATRLGDAFALAATGMALLDLDGRYVRANDRLCELLGTTDIALRGRSFWGATHPDDVAAGQAALRAVLEGDGRPTQLEKRWRRDDGVVVWVVVSCALVRDGAGQPEAVLATIQDISERKWAEDALVAQHALSQLEQRAAASANASATVAEAAATILAEVCAHTSWAVGHLYLREDDGGDGWISSGAWYLEDAERYRTYRGMTEAVRLGRGIGLVGVAGLAGAPRWTPDLTSLGGLPTARAAADAGLVAAFAFPVVAHGEVAGVMEFLTPVPFPPDGPLLDSLTQVAGHLGRVIERVRDSAALQASEERSRRIIETAGDAFVEMDDTGRITDWNRRAEETFGWARDEAIGQPLAELLIPERHRAAHHAGVARFFATGEGPVLGARLQLSALHRRGHELPIEIVIWPIPAGKRWSFGAFVQDISGRKQAEEALREAQERFRRAFHNAPIGMALVSVDGRFQEVNRSLGVLLGRSDAELVGQPTASVVHPDDVAVGGELRARALAGELGEYAVEQRWVRADGSTLSALLSISAVTDAEGAPRYFVLQVEDVTERREAEAALTWRALHDPLTGLANRALLEDRLGQALSRAERLPSSLAVLFLDLDGFKLVNDRLGHDAGDLVLVEVAARLRSAVRPADTVARLGGDEFVVLCEDLGGEAEALIICERLIDSISAPIAAAGGHALTASVGVAIAADRHRDAAALLRDADVAMYGAKASGKARWQVATSTSPDAERRRGVETALRDALGDARLRLEYLPTVELATGRLAGVEALLRYVDADGGLHRAAEFVGVAEDSGLIVAMGAWALEEVSRQARRWGGLRVSLNLSARQLSRPDFFELVRSAIEADGVLALEVTESVLLGAGVGAVAGLDGLRELGVTLGLDDYGTGVSSVTNLRRMPVDYVKIDRSVVAGLGLDVQDTATVAAVLGLARAVGLVTVAEGVETTLQADLLREHGCELAQGYLYSGPRSAEGIDELIASPAVLAAR